MLACANFGPKGGCTTAFAWWWQVFSSKTSTNRGNGVRLNSCTGSAMGTSRATPTGGSGRPGCGTDASPFYRVFNPISQGLKFDPQGDYVRRYIPELRHLTGKTAHEPWDVLGGYEHGYPEPIVDHKAEREVALADFAAIKKG